MQEFMPGTQPRGTYTFNPGSSGQSTTQMLIAIDAEADGAEDQIDLDPPHNSSLR
jgi:hypothetical protein